MPGNESQNAIESAEAKRGVVRHGDALARRNFGLQDDVAALLFQFDIAPMFAKDFDQLPAGKVTRNFHATARTSSRTRCNRMLAGSFSG